MDEKTICRNIKKFRKLKGLTLEILASRIGLTKGYLSRVERSHKAPPYSTLNKIAGALGMEVTDFLKEALEPLDDIAISFQKRGQAPLIKAFSKSSGYDYEILGAGKPGKNMETFIIYAPFETQKIYRHEGEEFIYVLEGALEFVHGDRTFIMGPGDNVYFDSCVPHGGRSLGEQAAKLLVVIYFYKRNRR